MNKEVKYALKTIMGLTARCLFVAPMLFAGDLIFNGSELITSVFGTEPAITSGAVVSFAIWAIAVHAAMLLICTTLIPAEYAIKTNLDVLEFNKSSFQVTAIYGFAIGCVVLAYIMAGGGFYWSAGILVAYGIANITWPRYVHKIDDASKADMIDKLKGNQEMA